MLRIDHLTKRYGDDSVFEGLTHTFAPGCVALCEEESTGKSSLLGIIAGVIAPDGGEVWIDGHSLAASPLQAQARLAYVPDNCLALPQQTGRGLLEQVAAQKGVALDDAVTPAMMPSRLDLPVLSSSHSATQPGANVCVSPSKTESSP